MASLLNWLNLNAARRNPKPNKKRTRRLSMESLERREVYAVLADLIAYRPVTPNINYANYKVPEAVELDPVQGAGIRINGDDDNRNGKADRLDTTRTAAADDDLVRVDVKSNGRSNIVSWTGSLAVWTSPNKNARISNGQSVSNGQQLWVEYVGLSHTSGTNTSIKLTSTTGTESNIDEIVFHTFKTSMIGIGGAFQDPTFLQGTFALALSLYQQGYDVHTYRDIAVDKKGTGSILGQTPVYDEIKNAIVNRGVANIAMVGMSYGGGAVHDIAAAMEKDPQLKGRLQYTAYIDAIEHYSLPAVSETRLPPGSKYHDNIYQRNDLFLKGNRVPGANSNIDASNWIYSGALLKTKLFHLTIDRDQTVRNTIANSLKTQLPTR